jgi:hypothetical protein
LCAGLIAGFSAGLSGGAAAQGVKIWVPSPVKVVPHKAPAARTSVKVVTVVITDSRDRFARYAWVPGIDAYNFERTYWNPLYPF